MCLPEALSVSGVTRCGTAQARQIREGECTKESIRNSPLQNPARKGMARLRGPKRNWLFLAGGFKRMSGAHCSPHPIAKEEASGLLVGKHLCHSQRSQRSPRGVFFSLLCCVQLRWMVVHPLDLTFGETQRECGELPGACAVAAGRLLSPRRLHQSAPR